MKSLMRQLILLALFFFAVWGGSTWNSVAVPQRNATLYLKGGTKISGDVYRTVHGDYEVHAPNGSVTRVPEQEVGSIAIVIQEQAPRVSFFTANWRFFVPAFLVLAVMLADVAKTLRPLVSSSERKVAVG